LAASSILHVENVRRLCCDWIQMHIVPLFPKVTRSGQEVAHPIRRPSRDAHRLRRCAYPRSVRRKRIEVDNHDHVVGAVLRPLHVREQLIVVDLQKSEGS
jgi:hypothetical protein